jgi:methylmalonyl-CoA/ethylmalonyl-CoA epimerase
MGRLQAEWIAELASPEECIRAHGASKIFAAGRALVDPAIRTWCEHKEFARLLGNDPEVTVGVAVWPETFGAIREANGWPLLAVVPAEQDASEFTLRFEDRVALDVLTSREPEGSGAIAKFLKRRGEGIQQVEFRCSDVDRVTALLREQFSTSAVYPETRPGADGTRVNFFLVAGADGKKVLIEFYQAPAIRFE